MALQTLDSNPGTFDDVTLPASAQDNFTDVGNRVVLTKSTPEGAQVVDNGRKLSLDYC